MADKKITVSVSGKEVVCNFGINYFYKHFKEITGIDMLVDGLKGLTETEMFDLVAHLYYAGYLADNSLKKEKPEFTKEDFEHMVLSGDESVAGKLVMDYSMLLAPGEAEAQTISP